MTIIRMVTQTKQRGPAARLGNNMKAGIMINRKELAQISARVQAQEDRVMFYLLAAELAALWMIGTVMMWVQA